MSRHCEGRSPHQKPENIFSHFKQVWPACCAESAFTSRAYVVCEHAVTLPVQRTRKAQLKLTWAGIWLKEIIYTRLLGNDSNPIECLKFTISFELHQQQWNQFVCATYWSVRCIWVESFVFFEVFSIWQWNPYTRIYISYKWNTPVLSAVFIHLVVCLTIGTHPFQRQFSIRCDLTLPLSMSSNFSFP
jgi:hypothetical protein